MLEEASGILGRQRAKARAQRLHQRLVGSGSRPSQEGLDFREGLLDEVLGLANRGQVKQLAAPRLDKLSYLLAFVSRQVVHHYHFCL